MLCVSIAAADAAGMPSLWNLIESGGPLMWPIGACSVIALAYAVERWVRLGRNHLGSDAFGRSVVQAAASGGALPALELCEANATPLARILAATLRHARTNRSEREKVVEDVAASEVHKISANLRPLLLVYLVAPLLGLLGTVWGMIQAFATIAMKQGLGKPELLAAGVYQALVTTAAGLTIAIPTVVVYYYLKGRVERFSRSTEELYLELDRQLKPEEVADAHP